MPLYDFRCTVCQSVFEEWREAGQTEGVKCPGCQEAAKRVWGTGGLRAIQTNLMSDAEVQMHLAHRREIESRADDLKTGKLEVKLRGPLEFRPKV